MKNIEGHFFFKVQLKPNIISRVFSYSLTTLISPEQNHITYEEESVNCSSVASLGLNCENDPFNIDGSERRAADGSCHPQQVK